MTNVDRLVAAVVAAITVMIDLLIVNDFGLTRALLLAFGVVVLNAILVTIVIVMARYEDR